MVPTTEDKARHHALEARAWADRASGSEEANPPKHAPKRVLRCAAISQAHSAAAMATMMAEGYLDVRTTDGWG